MHVTCQLRDPTQADQQCLREYLAPDPLANSSILDLSLSPIEKDFGEFELQESLDSSHSGDLESLTSGAFGSSLESAVAAADDSSEVTVHPSPSLPPSLGVPPSLPPTPNPCSNPNARQLLTLALHSLPPSLCAS